MGFFFGVFTRVVFGGVVGRTFTSKAGLNGFVGNYAASVARGLVGALLFQNWL